DGSLFATYWCVSVCHAETEDQHRSSNPQTGQSSLSHFQSSALKSVDGSTV
ncbi:hypothetical protein BaRGS_00019768, partial [Batillaria attramentaria]